MIIKRLEEAVSLNNVRKMEKCYICNLTVDEFSRIFNVQVNCDTNQKMGELLETHVNFRKSNVSYNPFIRSLNVQGSFSFIDGIMKYERHIFNPKQEIMLFIYALEHQQAENMTLPLHWVVNEAN